MTASHQIPIIVGHQDTLLRLSLAGREKGRSFFERGEQGHLDLPRAREGGVAGSFFAIFVPAPPETIKVGVGRVGMNVIQTDQGFEVPYAPAIEMDYARRVTMAMMATLFRLEDESDGQLGVVRSTDELIYCLDNDIHAAILHFEGAEAIDADLDALEVFYRAGLRSLGLVWSRPNIFAQGVPFKFPHSPDTGPGLTEAGRELVRGCNRLGIMLDLSHLNEQGFWDVARLSEAPLVATHCNAHALSPSTRNLTDRQLDAIKESGGIVGLNFAVYDLRDDYEKDPNTPLELLVRHIDHLVSHLGIDGVALGTDFDGTTVPAAIGDAAGMPNLVEALRMHGYDDAALRKIGYENWLRVLQQTWK
ncbi:MAG TPA: dipeptidase [Ktedonobacteraceae bacterium]|nr:dipeptidase [Ktedonobacteraceae bacterium]